MRNTLRKIALGFLILGVITFAFWGCSKDPIHPRGAKKIVEGIVFDDCNGNVAKGKKIILKYGYEGCFGGEIISEETVMTDQNGHYKFEYHEAIDDGSTNNYYHLLSIPNSSIRIYNPNGNMNLYPNDTLMNANIHLKFNNRYSKKDTLYFQIHQSSNGYLEHTDQIHYILGPFSDSTLVFKNIKIGNINSIDHGKQHCGIFKWGIGKLNLNRNYTGKDGQFNLSHEPCAQINNFDYIVEAIK